MTTTTKTLSLADLAHFTGDLERFRHPLDHQVLYTPGVRHVATAGGAYWLIDAIVSYLRQSVIAELARADERIGWMHFWTLTVNPDRTATLVARVDMLCEPFIEQHIEWTDFPLNEVRIWAAWDEVYWTLYLPSEH